jgi:alpha-N-arabinofuranosidase
VNRSLTETITVTADVTALGDVRVLESHTLTDDDLNAKNTLEDRERVVPADATTAIADGVLTLELPPVSWTAVALG